MPLFFFDCHDANLITVDRSGVQCRNPLEAERLAIRAVAGLARDFSPGQDHQRISIEIKDRQRRQVATVAVSLSIDRPATSVILRQGTASKASKTDELG